MGDFYSSVDRFEKNTKFRERIRRTRNLRRSWIDVDTMRISVLDGSVRSIARLGRTN